MKKYLCFLGIMFALLLVGCETFPNNPSKIEQPIGTVHIEHTGTEYVPANHPVVGVNANKTNILFFNICVTDVEVSSIEFLGRAMVEGSDGLKEHAIQFRTDEVGVNPTETGYTFNVLDSIQPSTQYTVVRSKFPTNDYAPFEGNNGMIQEVLITDVRAYNEMGEEVEVELR